MNTKTPRISIITPSFNQASFLERTIRSVIDQKYPNLDYWVIDGGSTDGSLDIILRHQDSLTNWISQRDRGQTDALNKGLARVDGDIVAYINSDDVLLPGSLDYIAQLMADGTKPWVVGGCRKIDADDNDMGCFDHHAPRSFADYLMHTDGMLPQPSCFWNRKLFLRHGGFDTSMHYCFDYEMHCRLLAAGHAPLLVDRDLAAFRFHNESKGGSQPRRFGLERLVVAERYANRLPLAQRLALHRNIGYRTRLYAIEAARESAGPGLWSTLLRKPWWLASEDIRRALWQDSRSPAPMRKAA